MSSAACHLGKVSERAGGNRREAAKAFKPEVQMHALDDMNSGKREGSTLAVGDLHRQGDSRRWFIVFAKRIHR